MMLNKEPNHQEKKKRLNSQQLHFVSNERKRDVKKEKKMCSECETRRMRLRVRAKKKKLRTKYRISGARMFYSG